MPGNVARPNSWPSSQLEIKLSYVVEQAYPRVVALVAGVAFFVVWNDRVIPRTMQDLFAAIIGVGAIAIGFLGTAKAILVTIEDREIIARLRELGYYRRIIDYIMEAISWSFALTVLSSAGLMLTFAETAGGDDWQHRAFLAFWAGTLVGAFLSYLRVVRIFHGILVRD